MSSARWYVVNVYAGSEKKVAESIEKKAESNNLSDKIIDVLIPSEKVVELKKGKKVETERNVFPGYVLVNMVLLDETWHIVNNIAKVTGFLGSKGKPSPIHKKEVDRLMSQIQDRATKTASYCDYSIGEEVAVIDGPFSSFNGFVEDVDHDKERLKVSVMIFSRATPVNLEFSQVKKT